MPIRNATISDLLRRYAAALHLEGVDRFKIKAYRRAADTIETLPVEVTTLLSRGENLKTLPGIGDAISAKIKEIVATGNLPQLDRALSKLAPDIRELADRPNLDPRRVQRIYKKLQINNLSELKKRLDSGEIRDKLGARLEFHVRQGLDERPRMLLWQAEKIAPQIERMLGAIDSITRVERVGSLRRRQETVGDLNFLVSGTDREAIFRRLSNLGTVLPQESGAADTLRVRFSGGYAIAVSFSREAEWGLNLLLKTGSDAHLRDLRATSNGSLLTVRALGADAADEIRVYHRLKLPFIEPELREGRGEVAAAMINRLPSLVEIDNLKGDLHMHTTASDGANSIEEMAAAAKARGYRYIAITDHSKSLAITNGLDEKRLFQQINSIDKINAKMNRFTILKSCEVDILADGSLDLSNSVLKELDFTICSIHSRFALNSRAQTERLMRAMDNPYFNILGHATGRLLLTREGYDPDVERLVQHAKERGCCFEINSSPNRLDLSDENARMAKLAGVMVAVNTDAHSINELNFIRAGINQARRAWLEPDDVLNAYPLAKLKKLLRRTARAERTRRA
jgi:DNA polymerase (family 10)